MTTETTAPAHPVTVRRRRRRRPGRWALLAVGVVLALLTVFPLVWMVVGSVKTPEEVNSASLIPSTVTLENYLYVFSQVPFARYLFNSFVVSASITLLALWFHSMAAYALARLDFPGRERIFLAIFATMLVSAPVTIIPTFIIVRTLGMVDNYAGLIVPAIFNAFGIFLLRQFYISLPDELEEAALVDGATYWAIYWRIVLPLSRPILAALAVFFFLANWNSFVWPMTVTSDPNLRVVQLGIQTFQQQYAADWNYILAASTVAALPTLAIFFVFQKQIVASIKTSGLK
ncbi:carbohydrate ABC transporter permease [Brachybacterium alimentarium]|uniref:carbohydrate ABC transporter permease n=1 Tax=Brachybacterium alimentarium TaxID=47845 RepID=UPI000DF185E1|nr:carbohydrate ABC transporter permease [Brachybacterium alimentarium]RCS79728.1 carbohydrate ABC transporter permease [Brachybacterium alimentarium]RCS91767.1 carbohydrate ABC transporter permease [Brachybacterium alimentarium]